MLCNFINIITADCGFISRNFYNSEIGYKNFIIKKIENFFSTIVNGIPPPASNPEQSNPTHTNPIEPTTTFVYRKNNMASLTFTVVACKPRAPRPQRNNTQTGVKVSSSWNRRPHQPRNKPKKTFCKVCFDAGKDEQCYNSHFVKDRPGPNGKIVCPTLLSTECRYCKETGHFKSHCPALARRKQQAKQARKTTGEQSWLSAEQLAQVEARATAVKMTNAQSKPKAVASSGAFECLGSDSEEEMCYERSIATPSIARPRSPQGYWGGKPVEKPSAALEEGEIEEVTPYDLSLQTDEEFRLLAPKAPRSFEVIKAELEEVQLELDAQDTSDNWGDMCDTDDLEQKVNELEEELAAVQNAAHNQLKEQKDDFGRPCADDSAW